MSEKILFTVGNDNVPPFRDIWEFYETWPRTRDRVVHLGQNGNLSPDERLLIQWMIRVMDRVSPSDLDQLCG
ncbi:hypothetical protein [Palleronia caenipelagi]|uniref:hypothetical protein n=1 Tax=Palleronia caenipelagi TaxID=2489174 RepID=UPI00115DD2B5|nr:hypothetical protein [Palleronia caenipelagi]